MVVTSLTVTLLGLSACKQDEEAVPLFQEIGTEVAGAQVGAAVGVGEVQIPVRVLNERGAAIAGSAVTVRAEGLETTEQTLTPDGLGVATLTVSGPPQSIEVSVTEAEGNDGDPATSWILGGALDGGALGWLPVLPQTLAVERTFAAEGGVALVTDDEVWWQPFTPGVAPQRMVAMADSIRGAWDPDVDADGLPDLVLWNGAEIVALRGHARAGYVWGWGAEMINGASLQWLSVGDADGDGLTDLVLLLDDGGGQLVQVLAGDGVWGFEALEPLYPDIAVRSLTAGLFNADGPASVLVLADDYRLRQYALRDEWGMTGGDLTPSLPADSFLAVARDLTGDGVDEALVLEPEQDSGDRQMTIINYGNGPTQYSVKYDTFRASFADLDGDRVQDVVISEGGADPRLGYITVKSDGQNFVFNTLWDIAEPGPVAAGDMDGDQVSDLALFDGDLRLFPGAEDGESGAWRVDAAGHSVWDLDALGPSLVSDIDGDGRAEIGVLRLRDERATLSVLDFTDDKAGELQLATTVHADVDYTDEANTASALDLAVCAPWLYAVVQDGAERFLFAVPTDQGPTDALVAGPLSAERVTCGSFGGGAVVAVGGPDDAQIVFYDQALAEVHSQSGSPGDLDASGPAGSQSVATCEGDCTVESLDVDGDGADEVLEGGAASGALEGWGEVWPLEAAGLASFVDFDGDGWLDSALTDTGGRAVSVFPTLSGQPGPATSWLWDVELSGPVSFGDVDGDGSLEALVDGPDGKLLHTAP